MPKKRGAKPASKYFVPVPRKTAPESPSRSRKVTPDAGAKYFARAYPLESELPELWDGTGPDLPPGYENAEACPDCSAFRYSPHAPLCIRNPKQQTFDLRAAWYELHTKTQIFFGAGHPITADVDAYMTMEKQRRLVRLGVVVMYDFPQGSSFRTLDDAHFENRQVLCHWREKNKPERGKNG